MSSIFKLQITIQIPVHELEILINDTYFKNILSNAKKNFQFILMLLLLDLKIQPPLIRKQETPTFKAISGTREILQKLLR